MYMQVEKRKVRDNSAWYHAVEDGSDDNSSKPSDDEEDKEAKEVCDLKLLACTPYSVNADT